MTVTFTTIDCAFMITIMKTIIHTVVITNIITMITIICTNLIITFLINIITIVALAMVTFTSENKTEATALGSQSPLQQRLH